MITSNEPLKQRNKPNRSKSIRTLLFPTWLPIHQNGFQNSDKVYTQPVKYLTWKAAPAVPQSCPIMLGWQFQSLVVNEYLLSNLLYHTARFSKAWFVIFDLFGIFLCFKVSCLWSFCFRLQSTSLLHWFFLSFLTFLSLARIKQCLLQIPLIITTTIVILSFIFVGQAGLACTNIVTFINPAPTQRIDGTEKPQNTSKFAKPTARYNEFGSKSK